MTEMLYAPKKRVELVHEWSGPMSMGYVCEAHRALFVCNIRNHNCVCIIVYVFPINMKLCHWSALFVHAGGPSQVNKWILYYIIIYNI